MNKDSPKQKCGEEFSVLCLKRESLQRYITKANVLGMKSLLLPKER